MYFAWQVEINLYKTSSSSLVNVTTYNSLSPKLLDRVGPSSGSLVKCSSVTRLHVQRFISFLFCSMWLDGLPKNTLFQLMSCPKKLTFCPNFILKSLSSDHFCCVVSNIVTLVECLGYHPTILKVSWCSLVLVKEFLYWRPIRATRTGVGTKNSLPFLWRGKVLSICKLQSPFTKDLHGRAN